MKYNIEYCSDAERMGMDVDHGLQLQVSFTWVTSNLKLLRGSWWDRFFQEKGYVRYEKDFNQNLIKELERREEGEDDQ